MGRNSQLFLSGCCPAPTCTVPAPWEVDRSLPRLQRGGTVLGEGPGVRPCTGSDSHWPPPTSLREVLGGGWRADTRGRQWFFFQHQARDRTGETRNNQASELDYTAYLHYQILPPPQAPLPFFQGSILSGPYQSAPPGQST